MKYCGTCTTWAGNIYSSDARFCDTHGVELTPTIHCLCGTMEYHPRSGVKFCSSCGAAFTDTYLGRCMAAQLKEMVGAIAEKQAVLPQGLLD